MQMSRSTQNQADYYESKWCQVSNKVHRAPKSYCQIEFQQYKSEWHVVECSATQKPRANVIYALVAQVQIVSQFSLHYLLGNYAWRRTQHTQIITRMQTMPIQFKFKFNSLDFKPNSVYSWFSKKKLHVHTSMHWPTLLMVDFGKVR